MNKTTGDIPISVEARGLGAPITITGQSFAAGSTVTVGGVPAIITSFSPTSIVYLNPAGVGCAATVVVTTPIGATAQAVFNAPPTAFGTVPASGSSIGGNFVFINGSGFSAGTVVAFNGVTLPTTLIGSALLRVTAPPGTPGPVVVTVTNAAGCSTFLSYTYL